MFKIVLFYTVFYVVMKGIVILQGAWLWVNLLLSLPFILLAGLGWYLNGKQNYSWVFIVLGILVISLVRYFESDWSMALHRFLN